MTQACDQTPTLLRRVAQETFEVMPIVNKVRAAQTASILAICLPTIAHAATYDFTVTIPGYTFVETGTFTTAGSPLGNSGDAYAITSISTAFDGPNLTLYSDPFAPPASQFSTDNENEYNFYQASTGLLSVSFQTKYESININNLSGEGSITFTDATLPAKIAVMPAETMVGTVPLPASAPMFGAALIALGAVGYEMRRKGKAAVAA